MPFNPNKPQNGDPGDKGDPGDVSAQQLSDSVSNTIATVTGNSSANSNGVETLDPNSFADPEVQTVANKINKLITALRR